MPKTVQIQISQPCHESWHNMTPNEQGRFCGSCQKIVVDFSAMNDKELLEYIANAAGYTACGRFSNGQLNRKIKTAENKRRFSWAYVWNVLLATFMITEANAQVCLTKKRALVPSTITRPDTANTAISTIAYKAKTFDVRNTIDDKPRPINPLLQLQGHVGGYIVLEKASMPERIFRFIDSRVPASLKKDVVIYPNPVKRGNSAQLKLALPTGDYKLEVLSTSGQLMLTQPLNIQTKEQQIELPTQEGWSAGTYWVRISSKTTRKVFQNKMLLQ